YFVLPIFLFVLGAGFVDRKSIPIRIQDVRVVEDIAADGSKSDQACCKPDDGRVREARREEMLAYTPARLGSAYPEKVGQDRQNYGSNGPIQLEPEQRPGIRPKLIHIGVGEAGHLAVAM